MDSDELWLAWARTQKLVFRSLRGGDVSNAQALLIEFKRKPGIQNLTGEIAAVEADIKARAGGVKEAIAAYLLALESNRESTYLRYVLEVTVANLYFSIGNSEDAATWHRRAITTGLEEGRTSLSTAIDGLLTARGGHLSDEAERLQVEQAVWASWRVLGVRRERFKELSDEVRDLRKAETSERS
jgi:tetratricopeptide (TPR) repeat protein